MSSIASVCCIDRRLAAGFALALIAMEGYSAPPLGTRAPSPTALLEERFPNRARTLREDDGRWLVDWLAAHWPDYVDATSLRRELDAQMKAGYSIEEGLLAVLPRYGLWTHAGYGVKSELVARLEAGCPVVVQFTAPSGGRRARRFAVITEIREHEVRGHYPGGGTYVEKTDKFLSQWARRRNWMLTACPPARATWPMRSPERMSLIRYYDQIGRVETGDLIAEAALAADPRNAELIAALGKRALQRGRSKEAEMLFRKALAENDRHVGAANNLAYLLGQQNRNIEEALALSTRAMLIEPANPRILHTQGFLLGVNNRWNEARSILERAWQRSSLLPNEARIQIGVSLMRAYVRTDSPDQACQIFALIRNLNPGLMLPDDVQAPLDLAGGCR